MLSRNRISLTYLLVSVCVLLVVTPARAECDCDKPENEQKERSGVTKFFHDTVCGVKTVAKSVGESVKDGYKFVKGKLTPESKTEAPRPIFPDIDLRAGEEAAEPVEVKLAN